MITRQLDLRKLNSMTKYPSIPTYHALGEKGRLTDTLNVSFAGLDLFRTEKVDGTNARIVLMPDTFIIGSREEFLYGKDDLIINPTQNIVPTVLSLAQKLLPDPDFILVFFGEVYGHSIGSQSKQYTSSRVNGFRLFDVVKIPLILAKEI